MPEHSANRSRVRAKAKPSGEPSTSSSFEAVVDLNLVASDQAIGLIRHPHNGHQFLEHCVCHTLLSSACGMRGDAIAALITHAHRKINHFLREWIEYPGSHDLLDVLPCAL